MTDLPKQLSDLSPADYNPRTITDAARKGLQKSLTEFGDLSGVVYNSRTGNLVAAHQRREALLESDFDVSAIRWGKPFEGVKGEEREGWFQFGNGARFRVRLVDWPETFEKAANVSANNPHISGGFTDDLFNLLPDLHQFPAFQSLQLGGLFDDADNEEKDPWESTADNKVEDVSYQILIMCNDENDQKKLVERLEAEGHQCQILIL